MYVAKQATGNCNTTRGCETEAAMDDPDAAPRWVGGQLTVARWVTDSRVEVGISLACNAQVAHNGLV